MLILYHPQHPLARHFPWSVVVFCRSPNGALPELGQARGGRALEGLGEALRVHHHPVDPGKEAL